MLTQLEGTYLCYVAADYVLPVEEEIVAPVPVTVANASNAKFISVSNSNKITTIKFSVVVTYSDGSSETAEYSISVAANNSNIDGKFTFGAGHDLEGKTLNYDIKGNGSNIKTFIIK